MAYIKSRLVVFQCCRTGEASHQKYREPKKSGLVFSANKEKL